MSSGREIFPESAGGFWKLFQSSQRVAHPHWAPLMLGRIPAHAAGVDVSDVPRAAPAACHHRAIRTWRAGICSAVTLAGYDFLKRAQSLVTPSLAVTRPPTSRRESIRGRHAACQLTAPFPMHDPAMAFQALVQVSISASPLVPQARAPTGRAKHLRT